MKEIYVAGGCFWGVEAYYKRLKGIIKTQVGYANGNIERPSYCDLREGRASQAETLYLVYDEKQISLQKICEHLLRIIDPFSLDRQGGDYGHQYRTGIFYLSEEDGKTIKQYIKEEEAKAGKKFAVAIEPLKNFYPAEDYHQDYLNKNPEGYCHIDFSLIKPEEKKQD